MTNHVPTVPDRQHTTQPPTSSDPRWQRPPTREHDGHDPHGDYSPHGGHRTHQWMMIACCIPMLIIVGVLVATGVAGSGAVLYAVLCLGMMALMMFAMPGGHRH